jgi:hypothetical protein
VRLAAFCILLGGCIESRLVVCDDGTACPAGNVCVGAALGGCARPDQLTACDLKADGDECMFTGFTGQCSGGVCVACAAGGCPVPGPRDRALFAIADGTAASVEYVPIGSEAGSQPLAVFVGSRTQPLAPVSYDTNDGSFEIPAELATGPHRVAVQMLPVPLELQWSATTATFTVPRTSRKSPASVPSGAGYIITPVGFASTPAAPSIATTGVLTFDNSSAVASTGPGKFTYLYAQYAKPLAGPIGAPETARGDWILVADWAARTSSQSSYSGWAKTGVDLAAGYSAPSPEPTWTTAQRTLSTTTSGTNHLPQVDVVSAQSQIDALGGLVGGTSTASHKYGVIPSPDVFPFSWTTLPGYNDQLLMIPFSSSAAIDASITVADPSASLGLTRAVYAGVWRSRLVAGVTLRSGLQAVTTDFSGALRFDAPLVNGINLSGVDLMSSDAVTVAATTSLLDLTFSPLGNGLSADDYLVVLAELAGSQLSPIRDYQVLEPTVIVDGSLLVTGHRYVFLITARKGFPNASQGDYRPVVYPISMGTTASRTFTVQ